MSAPRFFVGIDPASKDGDFTTFVTGEHMADGRIFIHSNVFVRPEEKKRVLEYTVDWCVGAQEQTVLRTTDRAAAMALHDKLHALAVKLNKLGVDVCVEMSSESALK